MQRFQTSSSVGCLRTRGKIMQSSEKFQVSASKVGEFYGQGLFCYQIITGGTHYLLSAYQLYSVNSMFIIDINKTKRIFLPCILVVPIAGPASIISYFYAVKLYSQATRAAENTARCIAVSLNKKYSEWKEKGNRIPFLHMYKSVMISAYHMASN